MKNLLTSILCVLLTACQTSTQPELHVFMWSNYIKPEVIAKFEKQYQCRVILDTYDSNEAMYAKLNWEQPAMTLYFQAIIFST